jgi:metal-sulfur cluster biosynthetic enzyme
MTSPACPMGDLIVDDAHAELDRVLPADVSVNIQVVWEPPWQPSMMSEQCRLRLGWTEEGSD